MKISPPTALLASILLLLSPAAQGAEEFTITEFGAVSDGRTLNTEAIQKAIDAAAAKPAGGEVVIPTGQFLSGSIFLKPKVSLRLEKSAVLLGSNRIDDYPKRITRIEGHFPEWRMALVNAQGMEKVRIHGEGKIDGNGILFWAQFWQRRKENPKCTNLEVERPRLMFIDRCKDVEIKGLTFRDSGFWNLHLYNCDGVLVEGLDIAAPTKGHILGPSTDGIDVDSSRNVTIRKCRISVNDDNIALKGSKGPQADQDANSPPVENIMVEDCVIGDGNGLITCGSEATLIRNVTVRNCRITGNATMLTLKLRPDTPQHYENILMENIQLAGNGRLLNVAPWMQFFDLKGHAPPSRRVNDITLRNIKGSFGSMGTLRGNQGDVIEDFKLEDIHLQLMNESFKPGEISRLTIRNVQINGKPLANP